MLIRHIKVGRTYEALDGTRWRVVRFGAGMRPDTLWAMRIRGLIDEEERHFAIATFAGFVVADVTPYLDPNDPGDQLLAPAAARERLKVAIGTLANWRSQGMPAQYLQAGISLPYLQRPEGIRYKVRDIDMFLETAAPIVPRPKEQAA
jgi:hypothetical protein